MRLQKKRLDYRWVIVGSCFLLGFFCLGFCSGNKSLYLAAITEALSIPRSLFSLNDSIRYLVTAAVSLSFATLMHKLGIRKMVCTGIICLVIQCVINATATTLWGFYAAGLFFGLGLSLCTTTMISFIIRRWCKENTGTILGFVLAANGIGSAIATQVVSPIIYAPGEPFGYRKAYLLMAGILVVVGCIVVPLLRERPKDSGPMTVPAKTSGRSRDWPGMDYEIAKKKPYFYAAAVCIFLTGMCLQGLVGINAAHMKDTGIDPAFVATVVSIHSLVLACSKFFAGFSYDKLGMRFTMTLCHTAAVLATLFLSMVSATALGKSFAVGYAVVSSLALPLETIMISLFASELFGNRAFPHTMGIFSAVNTAGYAASTPIANWCFDSFGSYVPVIMCYCAIMLAVTVSFQFILSAAHKDRKQLLSAKE